MLPVAVLFPNVCLSHLSTAKQINTSSDILPPSSQPFFTYVTGKSMSNMTADRLAAPLINKLQQLINSAK